MSLCHIDSVTGQRLSATCVLSARARLAAKESEKYYIISY